MRNSDNRIIETDFGCVRLLKKLGKGKSGVSYLADFNGSEAVFKEMRYEPCPYYSFTGNKVEHEINAYNFLIKCGIPVPELIGYNAEKNYLIKKYINGVCGDEWAASKSEDENVIEALFAVAEKAMNNGINIDYFPANFVIGSERLFYIDYEINPYTREWSLEEWGIYYWANKDGMAEYRKTGSWEKINIDAGSGKPVKAPFEEKTAEWKRKFSKAAER
jgi:predicted Ser/Thr protein kinase